MAAWDSSHTYTIGNVVQFGGADWFSLANVNLNHQPDISPTWWIPPIEMSKLTGYAVALPELQLSEEVGYAVALPQLQLSEEVGYAVALPQLQLSKLTGYAVLIPQAGKVFVFKASSP